MRARAGGVWLERLALVIASPVLFLLLAEVSIRVSGVQTDLARNEHAQIALPVWLLADETWVRDRQTKLRRSGGEPIPAAEVEWLYHFEEARYVQYKLKPKIDVEAVNPFNEIEVARHVTFRIRSNDDGFRERPFRPKAPGQVRIVTLGDSSTFGWGVDAEWTYQRLLEARLSEWIPDRFEVLNLGMPGYNTRHGLGVLRHWALALEPDLLIVSFGANDPRLVPRPTDALLAADDTPLGALRFAALRLHTYRLLRRLLLSAVDPLRRERVQATERQAPLVPAVDLDGYRDNLRAIVELGRRAGAPTIFVSVCTRDARYVEAMRQVARASGSGFLDVGELFTQRVDDLIAGRLYPDRVAHYRALYGRAMRDRKSLFVTSDGCHPHQVGHSLIADALLPMVRRALGAAPVPSPTLPGETGQRR